MYSELLNDISSEAYSASLNEFLVCGWCGTFTDLYNIYNLVCRALNMEQEQKEKEKEKDKMSLLPTTAAPTNAETEAGKIRVA